MEREFEPEEHFEGSLIRMVYETLSRVQSENSHELHTTSQEVCEKTLDTQILAA